MSLSHVSEWEKVFSGPMLLHDSVIPLFGHYENWLMHFLAVCLPHIKSVTSGLFYGYIEQFFR